MSKVQDQASLYKSTTLPEICSKVLTNFSACLRKTGNNSFSFVNRKEGLMIFLCFFQVSTEKISHASEKKNFYQPGEIKRQFTLK